MAEILFVSEYGKLFGGIERYMIQCAEALRRSGDKVTLATLEGSFDPDFATNFDATINLESAWTMNFDYVVIHRMRDAESLQRLFQTFDSAMLVHDHELYCPRRSYYLPFSRRNCHRNYSRIVCSLCAMCRKIKSWHEIKEVICDFAKTNHVALSAPRFVVISEFMRQCLISHGIRPNKINLIETFVHIHPAPIFNPKPRKLLFLGQLIRGKGVDLLLEGLKKVKNECVLTIVGQGNDEHWLRQLAVDSSHQVNFAGFVSDPNTVIQDSDIVILPHRWQEPFGLVGLEAMSWGKPLIGFALGGVVDYLKDGKTGLAVPPGDIAKLAEAIDQLLEHPQEGYSLGIAGQRLAQEKYSEVTFVKSWQKLWGDK